MGWGRYRGYYGGYGSHSKKASAASLSASTLQRVLAQKKAEEEASVRFQIQYQQRLREAQAKAEEEARLEALHGGKEALAKWRADNAERLQAERLAKMEAERKAAGEQAVVNEVAELRVELASLPPPRAPGGVCARFQLNKAQTKAAFRLTDKDIDALPKHAGTGRSKTLFASADIFAAVLRKEGKKQLRRYQAAYSPDLARRVVEEELTALEQAHAAPLLERGRKEAVGRLRQADDAAIAAEKAAGEAVERAIAAFHRAGDARKEARAALVEVATDGEVAEMGLVDLPEGAEAEDEAEEEDEASEASGASEAEAAPPRATLTKRAGKQAATPGTASSGPAKKKARVAHSEAGPSSSAGTGSSSAAAPPPAAARRPSRAAASAANEKMDALIKAGDGGVGGSDLLLVD